MGIEDQFVVHLQYHLGLHLEPCQFLLYADHGNLDHIGRGALDGRVDGVAFGEVAHRSVGSVNVAEVTAATQDGLSVASLLCERDAAVHVFLDAGVFLEILLDDVGSFTA